jgi:hypothetical protein
MTPKRAAWIAAAVASAPVVLFVWSAANSSPDHEQIEQFIFGAIVLATPLAIAAAVIGHRFAAAAHGDDAPDRFLRLATAGLSESCGDWGAAMRAELASIDDPRDRRRFAIGCAIAALRTCTGRQPLFIAIGMGVLLAAATFAVSRASLASGREGIMDFTLLWPPVVLFATAFIAALAARSFRSGLISGLLALTAVLIGVLAVSMAEAAHWYEVAGVYLMDGDYPQEGLDRLDAILDPVTPSFVVFHLVIWGPWPVLGAAAGSWRRHRAAKPLAE